MPKLSRKSRLRREVARKAAEEMAAEGDRSILDAAEKLAGEVSQVSVDGILEVFFCAALHDLQHNGDTEEVVAVGEALDRYNEGESDD